MSTHIKIVFLFLSLCFFGSLSICHAATYYVDFDTGSDASNGISKNTPWKRSPGDTSATGIAAATLLQAGDTVKFKGGVVYFGGVVMSRSGSSGSPIVYDGNHSGDWGNGRAVIDRQNLANSTCLTASTSLHYITIQGFELRNAGGWADDHADVLAAAAGTKINTINNGGAGIDFYSNKNHTNLVLNNLYIHRMGGWRNTQGWTQNTIQGAGIAIRNVNGVTISNCEMTKMKTAIAVAVQSGVTQNVEISNCDIHNYITWGIDIAPQSSGDTLKNITIRDTKIHDYAEFCKGNWGGFGEWPHTDGIFLRTAAISSVWENIRVHSNHFYCDGNPGEGGTASIYISQGASALIYNNLFDSDSQTRLIGVSHANADASEQIVRIYNNTFVANSSAIVLDTETDASKRKVYIQNNIFRTLPGAGANWVMTSRLSGVLPTVMDNNLYFDPGYTAATKYVAAFPSYSLFGDLRTLFGLESKGMYADPKHVNALTTSPSARLLQLTSSSPAIGSGANLSAYFTKDKAGNTRPSSGAWDIGAFQYQASGLAPNAPNGLQISSSVTGQ